MTRSLLMLAPYWPPMGGPGVQRAAKFAKFLPEFGVTPYVVTRRTDQPEDVSLLDDVRGVEVRATRHIPFQRLGGKQTGANEPANEPANERASRFRALKPVRDWVQVPDHVLSWTPFAVNAALRWNKEVSFTALYSTSPYHSTHLAALALKKRLGIPWVADFRDPWVGDRFTRYPTRLHERMNKRLEAAVVAGADFVTVVSEGMREDFNGRHPAADVRVIYNGYDPDDFSSGFEPPPGPPWVIRHTGTFYPDRKPDSLLRAMGLWKKRDPAAAGEVRLELYGTHHADVEQRLKELCRAEGIERQVSFHAYVPHAEAIELLQTSHALLLVPGPGKTTVTGKVFEYLAAGRPTLIVAPYPSGVDEVTGQGREHPLRADDTPEDSFRALQSLVASLHDGSAGTLAPRPEVAAQYSRRNAARQLADLLTIAL